MTLPIGHHAATTPVVEAVAAVESGALRVSYRVRNPGRPAIFVFAALPTSDYRFDASLAYVCHAGSGVAVLLQGMIPDPPGLVQMLRPKIPAAVRVDPGQVYAAEIRVGLPMLEWHAYAPPAPAAPARTVAVTQIRLELHYVLAPEAFTAEPYENFPGLVRANGHPVRTLHVTVPLPSSVELRERLDHFTRFGS